MEKKVKLRYFLKNKIDKPLVRLIRKKREKPDNQNRNGRREITTSSC